MPRIIDSGDVGDIQGRSTHPVILGKFLFDTPVYVHTGLGTIIFEGDSYLGIGVQGGISGLVETFSLVPAPVEVSLSGIYPQFFNEVLNSGNYHDRIILYYAHRNDNGTLRGTPWIMYRGRLKKNRLRKGDENVAVFTIQHVLSVLNKRRNAKYTDEEQQRRYPGDNAFARVQQMETVQLLWGRRKIGARELDRNRDDPNFITP